MRVYRVENKEQRGTYAANHPASFRYSTKGVFSFHTILYLSKKLNAEKAGNVPAEAQYFKKAGTIN